MQRPWMSDVTDLFPYGLLSFLSYRIQNYQPRGGTTYYGLGPPQLITNLQNSLPLDLMEAVPQLELLLLG